MATQGVILAALRDIQATRFSSLAAGMIVLYEHVITFDEEVELIWRSNWSTGKVLFIANRYYTLVSVITNYYGLFAADISESVRKHFFKWQGWTGLVTAMLAEIILQMRLYALYFMNRKVLAVMVSAFLLCSASSAVIMGMVLSHIKTTTHILPNVPFCVPLNIPSYFYTFWIPLLAFETLLCGLALYRVFSGGTVFSSGRQLIRILVRDSVFYFLIMFATYLTNLLVWTIGRTGLLEIPIGFSVSLSCILANRIVLNVRRASRDAHVTPQSEGPHASGTGPGLVHKITAVELMELRSMRVEQEFADGLVII